MTFPDACDGTSATLRKSRAVRLNVADTRPPSTYYRFSQNARAAPHRRNARAGLFGASHVFVSRRWPRQTEIYSFLSPPPPPPPPPRRGVLFMRGGSIPRGLPKVPAAEDAARRFGFMRANGALFCAVSRRYFRDLGNGACREQIPAREQSPFLQSRTTTTSRRIRLPFVRFAALVNGSAAVYPRTLGDQLCMSEMITRKRERFRRVRIDHLLLNQIREILRR